MTIFCWGNTSEGQLGLGGVSNEPVVTPVEMPWTPPNHSTVRQIACGANHSLFLTTDGKVFACGDNESGQLGHDLLTKRPRMSMFQLVSELKNLVITQVACGSYHSLALTEWGQVYSWGRNGCGQLGHFGLESCRSPKIIREMGSKVVVQVASGAQHNLALTNAGELYAWGSNQYGQLGLTFPPDRVYSVIPTLVKGLQGIPVAHIACGGYHSFVVSTSGAIFAFGRNSSGQLGLSDTKNRSKPTQLNGMRSLGIRYIACGEEFSMFLTHEGGVFSCGLGKYGQLGHGGDNNELLPRQIVELMGSTITQVACGSNHSLVLVPTYGRVYGFGLGCSGQLGNRLKTNALIPQVVIGPWVSPECDIKDAANYVIKQIFSGGQHSMAIATDFSEKIPPVDCRKYEPRTQILNFTMDLAVQCASVGVDGADVVDLFTPLETIFSSPACLNGSFLIDKGLERYAGCSYKFHGVDLALSKRAFQQLARVENEGLKQVIFDKITNDLMPTLKQPLADLEALRLFLIMPLYHEFVNSKNYAQLHSPFSVSVLTLPQIERKVLSHWYVLSPLEYFEYMVNVFKNVVIHIISFTLPIRDDREADQPRQIPYESNLVNALNMLSFLYHLNAKERKEKVGDEAFHWNEISEYADLRQEYIYWMFDTTTNAFHICNYSFLFNGLAKTILLQTDQAIQMHNAMQKAIGMAVYLILRNNNVVESQYIYLEVSRANLVNDTLRELSRYSPSDLKKPLKIKFLGEEAEDAGGLRKEFFMLLLRELFDPKYGMFKEYQETRCVWFSDIFFEDTDMYHLIGVICGLAIYNFTIINFPFTLAMFKKLLNEDIGLADLKDLSPTLARSLQQLLDYEGSDFEDVFGLSFEITRDLYGHCDTVELRPGGSKIPVTQQNKTEYVDLYVDYVFNKSCELQFKRFKAGFMRVMEGRVLGLFRPHELMALVVGREDYDWQVFEHNCEYKNGYNSSDQTIRWFWEVFHELSLNDKKNFLLYLTGSDRIPIQGMKALKITIQPTTDDRYLPVAHTCFNLLDLPRYQTKERLRYKLLQAIQQTQGFSLV